MERLFAIGDIHGCFDSFKRLIENQISLNKNDKLILLGDYIDRGNNSKEVLDYILQMQNEEFDIVPLIGNHEKLLLDALKDEKNNSVWFQNGGIATLKSFNIDSVSEIPQKYIDFLKSLIYYHIHENYLFVHAGFNDNSLNPFQDKYSMIWHSQASYANPMLVDKTIIHGHRPVSVDFCIRHLNKKQRVINIDTGCVYKENNEYGKLTAIEIYSKKLFSI